MINNNVCVWDALKNNDKPIILYGMGNGADKVLDEFKKRNIKCSGVMASDDFVRYQNFRGFTVKKMADFEAEFSDFIIALCFASSLPDVMAQIRYVASKHTLLIPNVPVYGYETVDDNFISIHKNDIKKAYTLLADEKSKKVFENTLYFLYSGKPEYIFEIDSHKDEVFDNILKLNNNERYLDLGAYRGDTVDEFLHYVDAYTSIVAVEPNLKNHTKMIEHCRELHNFTAINAGIADKNGTMLVSKNSGRQSIVGDTKGIETPVVTLNNLVEIYSSFTYIKADIEGMEHQMLMCADNALTSKPKLNIAAYHTNSDFFTLILRLYELNSEYKFYLRKHPYIPCWDLNIYCV